MDNHNMDNITMRAILNITRPSIEDIKRKLMRKYCLSSLLPSAAQIIGNMNVLDVVHHVFLLLMATATIALFIEHVFFLKENMKQSSRRRLTLIQAGIPSVFAFTSVLGLFSPVGYLMIDFVTSVYFGFAIHSFLVLIVNYYGGLKQLLTRFQRIDRTFMISTGPLCCFFRCIPEIRMTKKVFTLLWYATFQAAFFRPIILLLQAIFDFDPSISVSDYIYICFLVASMLTGVWALVILRKASGYFLSRYRVTGKYLVFQTVLLICNVQPVIIKLSNRSCDKVYTLKGKSIVLNYQIMIYEFFVIALLTRFLYGRKSDDENLEPLETKKSPNNNHHQNGSIVEKKPLITSEHIGNGNSVALVINVDEDSRNDSVI